MRNSRRRGLAAAAATYAAQRFFREKDEEFYAFTRSPNGGIQEEFFSKTKGDILLIEPSDNEYFKISER